MVFSSCRASYLLKSLIAAERAKECFEAGGLLQTTLPHHVVRI
jgi:hypothetical protein